MRYIIAASVATLVIGALFVNHGRVASFEAALAGLNVGIDVSPSMSFAIQVSHAFRRLWFAIIPLVLVLCFGAARLAGRPS